MVRRARGSTVAAFFLAGFVYAAWAALVPFAKARTGMSDGQFSGLLLCLGLGSVAMMPVAGAAITRVGCRCVIIAGALLAAATLPVLATATSLSLLGLSLLLFGGALGMLDTAMNVHGVEIEKLAQRPLLSGFHAFFSIGGILGAGGMSLLFSASLSPLDATLIVSGGVLVGLLSSVWWLLPTRGESRGGPLFVMPHGAIWLLGSICCVIFLAEGAVLDWGGIFLTAVRHVEVGHAGWGYTVFAVFMMLARLAGNGLVGRIGARKMVMGGAMLAVLGWVAIVMIPSVFVTYAGYGMIGLGCANVVPLVYSAIGRQKVMPQNVAVPAVTMLGYAGILVGPVLVGVVASWTSLEVAFLGVGALLLLAVLAAPGGFGPQSE